MQIIYLSGAQHWNMYDVTIVTETLLLLCYTFLAQHAVLSLLINIARKRLSEKIYSFTDW